MSLQVAQRPPATAPRAAGAPTRLRKPSKLFTVHAGQKFWEDNRETLACAELEYNVPASLIVGVISVETLYGQHTGNYRVIDTLAPRGRNAGAMGCGQTKALPGQPCDSTRLAHGPD